MQEYILYVIKFGSRAINSKFSNVDPNALEVEGNDKHAAIQRIITTHLNKIPLTFFLGTKLNLCATFRNTIKVCR